MFPKLENKWPHTTCLLLAILCLGGYWLLTVVVTLIFSTDTPTALAINTFLKYAFLLAVAVFAYKIDKARGRGKFAEVFVIALITTYTLDLIGVLYIWWLLATFEPKKV